MVNENKVKGTVVRFFRGRGFGFIKPEAGGKEVFVHWEDLVTDDHWPFVKRDTEVEYVLEENDGKYAAKEVTLVDGEKIPIFVKPYENREVNKEDIYTGTVKFFDGRKGFGFVTPDEEISWENTSSGDGLFFSRDAFIATNAGKGMVLRVRDGLRVSFKIYKDEKGLGACEVQNEDQTPLECVPRKDGGSRKRKRKRGDTGKKNTKKVKTVAKTKDELIAEREVDEDDNVYTGTVMFYKQHKEFGFIKIEEEITFKDTTISEKLYVMKEDIVCDSEDVGLTSGSEVMFKIYKDSKGLGAAEVMNLDGTSITYLPETEESKADEVEEEPQEEVEEEPQEVLEEQSPEPVKPKKKTAKPRKKAATKKNVMKRKKKVKGRR